MAAVWIAAHGRPRVIGLVASLGLALASITSSGCMTSLGYVPGYVDKRTARPDYSDVREWAARVREGYDTRMTLNRYAAYYGALLAAGAAGAVTGLAAFDTGASALIGIPIGTAFLGGVMAVFQSEEKAKVYGHASRYISDLIAQSDQRVVERGTAYQHPTAAKAAADRALIAAEDVLDDARERLKDLQNHAATDLRAVSQASGRTAIDVAQKRAGASQSLVTDAEKSVAAAQARVAAAHRRVERAQARLDLAADITKTKPPDVSGITDEPTRVKLAERAEARCLERDVLEVTARVANLLFPLIPNSAEALSAVRAPGDTKDNGSDPKAEDKPKDKPAPPSLADFNLPALSSCADDV